MVVAIDWRPVPLPDIVPDIFRIFANRVHQPLRVIVQGGLYPTTSTWVGDDEVLRTYINSKRASPLAPTNESV